MSGRVEGKVAIVTGAAQGLGQASAQRLAEEGATVLVTDVKDDVGEETAFAITEAGGIARFIHLDVTDERNWLEVIEDVSRTHGALHIVFNNAGIAIQETISDTTVEQWDATMAINLRGVFLGTKLTADLIAASGGGSIINMSSAAGIRGNAGLAAYSASKGGVRLLTKSAALSYGRAGTKIRVNSVHPGFVETPLMQPYLDANPHITVDDLKALHALGVLGEPRDIANGVLYLASDESKWVTGLELIIDGGMTAG